MLTPLAPSKGSAVIFSSGWENMHQVEPLRDGTRFAVPSFFTTCPVPPELLEAPPADGAAFADELRRTLLSPQESADVQTFMSRWHLLLAPGR